MRNHVHKKRHTKKPVAMPSLLTTIHWGSMLGVFTVVIGCVMLVAFASNQSQTLANNSTTSPSVTSASSPTLTDGDPPASRQTTGVFPLSAGGPIPIPANVLQPTNIARVIVNNVLTSIYAGSMTRTPAIGALAILQENLTTGQQSLHLYQTSQPVGALTILAVHNDILTLAAHKRNGSFNLSTDQFQFP